MFDLNKFLELREQRVELQNSLIKKYSLPLVAIRTNYPGEDKLEPLSLSIVDTVAEEIEEYFSEIIIHKEILKNLEGKIYLFLIISFSYCTSKYINTFRVLTVFTCFMLYFGKIFILCKFIYIYLNKFLLLIILYLLSILVFF